MDKHILSFILQAEAKVLATIGVNNVNVVPVSTIRCVEGKIWLFDYFMNKTVVNINDRPQVALTCWSGMQGYQLKGRAQYVRSGEAYETACDIVKELNPDRLLQGLIIIDANEIFSVSPGKNSEENLL